MLGQANPKEFRSKVPESVPRFTFEVMNSASIGRHLIHLEDLIGPEAKKVGDMRPSKIVLVLALGMDCADCEQHWTTLNRAQKMARKYEVKVIGLLWSTPNQKSEIKKRLVLSKPEAIIGWDEFQLARYRLGLLQRGSAVIIRGDGSVDGRFAGAEKDATALLAAFTEALKEGR